MKSIAAGLLSKAQSGEISPFMLLDFEVPSGEVSRYTDCDIDLMYRGNRYTSKGFLVEPISFSLDRYADQCVVEIDATDQTLFPTFVGNSAYGMPMNVRYVLVDNYGNLLPYGEDYEGMYETYDPDGKLAVSETEIIFTDVGNDDDIWSYYDFGEDYFDGDFEHQFEFRIDATPDNGAGLCLWSLTTDVDNMYGLSTAGEDFLGFYALRIGTSRYVWLIECNAGSSTFDQDSINWGTTYYATVYRDMSVGTYGTLYCKIYYNAARTSLYRSLSKTLAKQYNLRYLFAFNTSNTGTSTDMSGRVANLVLDGGAGGQAIPWFNGEIDDVEIDVDNRVKIVGATMFSRWRTNTINLHSPSCRYKIFKGEDCGYSGEVATCDRTKTKCISLGNELNFGGFEWLPSIVDTEVWWGGEPGFEET